MGNDVVQDALKLASNILKSLLSDEKLAIVNIAIGDRGVFFFGEYPSIPQSFGYKHDKTLILLRQHGIIEGETIGWWYIGITKISSYLRKTLPVDLSMDDNISRIARKKGQIDEDEAIDYYYNVSKEDAGPKMHGQVAILVNKKMLENFINSFSKSIQIKALIDRDYWYEDKQLRFRLKNGAIDQFDFSKAKVSRKIFETFFTLWQNDGVGTYRVGDIVKEYSKIFKKEYLLANRIGEIVSNIRASIINPKSLISNRIEWQFDRKNKQWIFRISSLKH